MKNIKFNIKALLVHQQKDIIYMHLKSKKIVINMDYVELLKLKTEEIYIENLTPTEI